MRAPRINLQTFPRNLLIVTLLSVLLGLVANECWVMYAHTSRYMQHYRMQEEFASAEDEMDPMERLMEILREQERPVSPQWHWFTELDLEMISRTCFEERYADLGEGAGPKGERFLCLSSY